MAECPFKPATEIVKRPKLFIWGPPGAGKTRCALSLGKAAYISLEKGAQHYGKEFDFSFIEPKTFVELLSSVTWLASNKHDFEVLIIDPIGIAWEMCQSDYLEAKRKAKGDTAEITGADWKIIKPRYQKLMKLLTTMDMTVVAIARAGTKYVAGEPGSDMFAVDKNDPEAPQGEKNDAYIFDTELQLKNDNRGGKQRFMATTRKDRTGLFPNGVWEFDAKRVKAAFGTIMDQTSVPILESISCEACGIDIEPFQDMTPAETAEASRQFFGGRALCTKCRASVNTAEQTSTAAAVAESESKD